MTDAAYWQPWFRANGPALLLYARQWASSQNEAEDLLQEAFVRFWKNRGQVDGLLAYMFSCIRSAGIDGARSCATRKRSEEQAVRERLADAWFHPAVEADDFADELEAALRRLPAEQRETVILKIWGGLTFDQIGRTMQTSQHTAASRYRYALQTLRQHLLQDRVA